MNNFCILAPWLNQEQEGFMLMSFGTIALVFCSNNEERREQFNKCLRQRKQHQLHRCADGQMQDVEVLPSLLSKTCLKAPLCCVKDNLNGLVMINNMIFVLFYAKLVALSWHRVCVIGNEPWTYWHTSCTLGLNWFCACYYFLAICRMRSLVRNVVRQLQLSA